MRLTFCPDKPPKLSTGIFMVAWTLDHTIKVNPGGINAPLNIAVLKSDGKGKYRADELSEDEMSEHENLVGDAYNHLSAFKGKLLGEGAPAIPD